MRNSLLMAVSCMAVAASAEVSQGAIITVVANYKAGPPATAQPSGNGSVTAAKSYPPYRVVVDFGSFTGGKFVLWGQSPTGTTNVTPDVNGNFNWQIAGAIQLVNPPAGLQVRARLQTQGVFGTWSDVVTAYASCP